MCSRSLLDFFRSQVTLSLHIKPHNIFDIAFKMFQVDREFIFFGPHGIQTVVTIPELNDFLSVTCSYCVIVHDSNIFNQLDQSSLHVPSVCCLDGCIDDTLSTTHCVEKELCSCQTGKEAVFDEASGLWGFKQSWEVRQ